MNNTKSCFNCRLSDMCACHQGMTDQAKKINHMTKINIYQDLIKAIAGYCKYFERAEG